MITTHQTPTMLDIRSQAADIDTINKKGDEVVLRLYDCYFNDPNPERRAWADTMIEQLNILTAHLNGVRRLNLSDKEVLHWLQSEIEAAETALGVKDNE